MSLAYSVSVDVNELPSIFPLPQQTITMVVILRSAAAEQAATQGPLTNSVFPAAFLCSIMASASSPKAPNSLICSVGAEVEDVLPSMHCC